MPPITRYRGDTRRIRRTVTTEEGTIVPIDGWTFTLTINRESTPLDDDQQIAQIAGVIYDGPNGIVDFFPTYTDIGTAGTFFFDIEAVDENGDVTTLDKDNFILLQDITKNAPAPPVMSWVAEGTPGTDVSLDGSDFWYGIAENANSIADINLEYAERDGITVAAVTGSTTSAALHLFQTGEIQSFYSGVWDFNALLYIGGTSALFRLEFEPLSDPQHVVSFNFAYAFYSYYMNVQIKNMFDQEGAQAYAPDDSYTLPSWFRIRVRINFSKGESDGPGFTPSAKARIWEKDSPEPTDWPATALADSELDPFRYLALAPKVYLRRANVSQPLEIAEFSYSEV